MSWLEDLTEGRVFDWTLEGAQACARIMETKRHRGEPLDGHLPDAMIAAAALNRRLTVMTRNEGSSETPVFPSSTPGRSRSRCETQPGVAAVGWWHQRCHCYKCGSAESEASKVRCSCNFSDFLQTRCLTMPQPATQPSSSGLPRVEVRGYSVPNLFGGTILPASFLTPHNSIGDATWASFELPCRFF